MAAPAIAATTSLSVFAVGAVANLLANDKPLQAKIWDRRGGFIGLANGRKAPGSVVVEPPSVSSPPAVSAPKGGGSWNVPIGGQTDKEAPPTPFGRFPKCRPTKLPGPPKPYDPNTAI